jgi:hypothetical protein
MVDIGVVLKLGFFLFWLWLGLPIRMLFLCDKCVTFFSGTRKYHIHEEVDATMMVDWGLWCLLVACSARKLWNIMVHLSWKTWTKCWTQKRYVARLGCARQHPALTFLGPSWVSNLNLCYWVAQGQPGRINHWREEWPTTSRRKIR